MLKRRAFIYFAIAGFSCLIPGLVYAASDSYDGSECTWNNSLLGSQPQNSDRIAWTGGEHGGDVGFDIPARYNGKYVQVEFSYEVLQGRAQVGVDLYSVGMEYGGDLMVAPWSGSYWVRTTVPSIGSSKAVIRLKTNSRVRVKWATIKTLN
jgi:hypothetical protein